MVKKKKEKPIVINASFEQLVKESIAGNPAPKPKEKKSNKEKKNNFLEYSKNQIIPLV